MKKQHSVQRSHRTRTWLVAGLASVVAAAGMIAASATSASAAPVNISQGRTASASSAESPDLVGSKAVDGDNNTRCPGSRPAGGRSGRCR